jgi:predicted phosphodiesterase
MKKLAIMSDLHIDSNQFGQAEIDTLIQTLQEEEVVHLHLAGDISNHHEQASLPFLEQVRQHLDVSYNLGNHDMLELDEAQIEAENFQLLYSVKIKNSGSPVSMYN